MRRRSLGVGAVVGGLTLIGGQAAYATLRRLPTGADFDPSGNFGDAGLPTLRLTVLGDSAVTGHGLDHVDESWPRLVAARLSQTHHVMLRSFAVGGSRSVDVLVNQVPIVEQSEHDVSILSVGANDMLRMTPAWRLERRLDEIVRRLKAVSRSVVLFGVGDLGSIPRLPQPACRVASGTGHLADWVQRRVATRHEIAKVDQWGLTTEAFHRGPHMFAPDLFHPSAEGHVAWADAVMPTLTDELARLAEDLEPTPSHTIIRPSSAPGPRSRRRETTGP